MYNASTPQRLNVEPRDLRAELISRFGEPPAPADLPARP
jgi:hypothetical protein